MKIEQKTYIEMNRNVLGKQIILCEIVEFVRLRKRVCWREFYFVGPGIISLSSIEGVFLQLHSQASYLYFLHIHFTYILSHIKFYEWKFVCECFFFLCYSVPNSIYAWSNNGEGSFSLPLTHRCNETEFIATEHVISAIECYNLQVRWEWKSNKEKREKCHCFRWNMY